MWHACCLVYTGPSIFFFFFFHPILWYSPFYSDSGSHGRLFFSLPTTLCALNFYREKTWALSSLTRVELCLRAHARRSQQLILLCFRKYLVTIKFSPRRNSNYRINTINRSLPGQPLQADHLFTRNDYCYCCVNQCNYSLHAYVIPHMHRRMCITQDTTQHTPEEFPSWFSRRRAMRFPGNAGMQLSRRDISRDTIFVACALGVYVYAMAMFLVLFGCKWYGMVFIVSFPGVLVLRCTYYFVFFHRDALCKAVLCFFTTG